MNYQKWMADLPDNLKECPIYDLLIPGSHDSVASHYDSSAQFEKSDWMWASWFSWIPKVKKSIIEWMYTQDLSLYDQLYMGIRKLDLRLSYDELENQFYFTHTYAAIKVEDGLAQVEKFLSENTEEILILKCSKDCRHTKTIHKMQSDTFLQIVIDRFGDLLAPSTPDNRIPGWMSISNMVAANQRIIFNYRPKFTPRPEIWKIHVNELTEFTDIVEEKWTIIDKFLEENKDGVNDGTLFREIALTLTPQPPLVLNTLFNPWAENNSTLNLTQEFRKDMLENLNNRDITLINSFIIDFPKHEYIDWVINYNLEHR